MWEQAWKKVWKEKTSCHHLPKITNVAFPLLLLLFPSYFPPPSSLAHTCPFLFHWGTDHLSIVQLVLVRVNWLAAERGGVLKCVFLPRLLWADSSHQYYNEVHTTLPACLPACQCDKLSPSWRTNSHAFTYTHSLMGQQPVSSHMLMQTHRLV